MRLASGQLLLGSFMNPQGDWYMFVEENFSVSVSESEWMSECHYTAAQLIAFHKEAVTFVISNLQAKRYIFRVQNAELLPYDAKKSSKL